MRFCKLRHPIQSKLWSNVLELSITNYKGTGLDLGSASSARRRARHC